MKDYKSAIIPVVATVCLAVGAVTGHNISASLQDEIESIGGVVIGAALSIWGIFKSHKK